MGKGERPEHTAPPEIFYNEDEARKYTTNSRMIAIQATLTARALELLALPPSGGPRLLLDIGCGSGLSGEALSEAGHAWVGCDISEAMLDVAVEREVDGDVLLSDMGQGLPLRRGAFDGAISISAVQWLCNADRSSHDPRRRLKRFFETLYACLARGARAVLQIYPENGAQAEMLVAAAMKVGFSGGLVVDYPHSTRAKKYFLVLMVGTGGYIPQGKDGDSDEEMEEGDRPRAPRATVAVAGRERKGGKRRGGGRGGVHGVSKDRGWVVRKKDKLRRKGHEVKPDTKYTARKRRRVV
ncbi:MAG: S-adenosyl-L-methionine-dependent methyltransferase [Monoraphidium minutum]|nr:MAG: S-adenosyl-L-methionine-dependent methyltransferase [Monoraphidium minutum]